MSSSPDTPTAYSPIVLRQDRHAHLRPRRMGRARCPALAHTLTRSPALRRAVDAVQLAQENSEC
jgi:hypothetical protein